MRRILDLNADVGESYGHWRYPQTHGVMQQVTTAHIACGFHAGDPSVMRQVVRWCREYGVRAAAHPGFPDLLGFGRRMMGLTLDEAYDALVYQVGALQAFARIEGVELRIASPHGAFFVWGMETEERAECMVAALQDTIDDLVMYLPAQPRDHVLTVAARRGVRVVPEFYPGLAYDDNGHATYTRDFEDSGVVERTLAITAKWLDTGLVDTTSGGEVELEADAINFHGDVATAPEILAGIRSLCRERAIEVKSLLAA